VWVLTPVGLALIFSATTTLEAKARSFFDIIPTRHFRYGLVSDSQ
jgi:hypothetical protein